MKKILHMTPGDVRSGVYRYIFNNLEYMDKKKYKHGFLTRAAAELVKSNEYNKYHFTIHPFYSTQRENPKELENEVRSVLECYDIIHLHTSSWRGFMIEQIAMDINMEKVIVHSHSTGIDIQDDKERIAQIKEHLEYRKKFGEQYATDFCACSKSAAEWLFGDSISPEKITYMPNAVDTLKYRYNNTTRQQVRERLHLEERFVVGHVGRYSYTKNQELLIRCIANIKDKYPNITLICIGQGELKEYFAALIEQLHVKARVILLDWQSRIWEYLQAFDLFCLPSKFEGFPISVVEAQAAGLPCLVSSTVTEEVAITPLVRFVSCDQIQWERAIINCMYSRVENRYGYDELVAERGFDIRRSAGMLEELYDR